MIGMSKMTTGGCKEKARRYWSFGISNDGRRDRVSNLAMMDQRDEICKLQIRSMRGLKETDKTVDWGASM